MDEREREKRGEEGVVCKLREVGIRRVRWRREIDKEGNVRKGEGRCGGGGSGS